LSAPPVRLMLVEDHALVRSGLRLLLEAEPGFRVVAEAGDVPAAVALAASELPDVVLVDIGLPGASGIDCMVEVRAVAPAARLIAVTMMSGPAVEARVAKVGGYAVVNKAQAAEVLVRTILGAMAGEPSPLAVRAAKAASTAPEQQPAPLTPREREVLAAIARGLTNAEISAALAISAKTVEVHRAHLGEKLGLRTRAQLVRWVLEHPGATEI
jgi:two-component system response regulator NreC